MTKMTRIFKRKVREGAAPAQNGYYPGIDYFRVAAAFLIIAIHTSPLSSYSGTADFVLTRIIARVAVPFFLMTSGFFLITRYNYNDDKLKSFMKRTALVYGISMLVCLPLNIYNDYFTADHLLPKIIKDIVFDGTLYHLWYLPASITGAALAWFLVKKIGFGRALPVTFALYVVGLFGDSYYGLVKNIPLLKSIYDSIFEVSDYTRNGIFMAPVFFVLGGIIADRPARISIKKSLACLPVSLLFLFFEGMLLHNLELQRHDSMYVFLLPVMYFLFQTLTFWRGRRLPELRTAALLIYIIHPMMIVAVRMFAKISGLQVIFNANSLVHYAAVSVCSAVLTALILLLRRKRAKMKTKSYPARRDRSWIELDLNNLKHNVETLTSVMPGNCGIMAVVKAEAYGHGAFEVSSYINRLGVNAFAAATIDEGILLRRYGIRGEILIMGYTSPLRAKELHKYDLTQTLIDDAYARLLAKQKYRIKAHIKIDTGMRRFGYAAADTDNIVKAFQVKNLEISGIYTHLCASDSLAPDDVTFTETQIASFYNMLDVLAKKGIRIPKVHIQSSYGLLNYPEFTCDYARLGISLYGVLSLPDDRLKSQLDLRPVLSLKSQIVLIRKIQKGDSVGYNRTFIAGRDSVIAILPIGYADGFPRNLSNGNGEVLIRGKRAPIIGRICMDQLTVDVTDIGEASVGDTATLIGSDGEDMIFAENAAENSESITNELLSRMGKRLHTTT